MYIVNPLLVPCRHAGAATGADCDACEGSGYVRVIVARDGEPRPCEHGANDGELDGCDACLGSGWAGLCD